MRQTEDDPEETSDNGSVGPFSNLAAYLEARPELGFRRMLLNLMLEPPDPFKPKERRRAKKGFVISAIFLMVVLAWFSWFNFVR